MDGHAIVPRTGGCFEGGAPATVVRPSKGVSRFASHVRESPLSSLAGSSLAGRFCAWGGASDQRVVASIYAVDRDVETCGLPAFESFILIAVATGPLGRRILDVTTIERSSDRRGAVARGLSHGADEWHVHFLAEDRRARAAMVADLRARHCGDAVEARCA